MATGDLGVVTSDILAPTDGPMGSGVANRRERILYREVLPALGSQLAEETDSKTVQCEFESHRGHGERPARRVFTSLYGIPQPSRYRSHTAVSRFPASPLPRFPASRPGVSSACATAAMSLENMWPERR